MLSRIFIRNFALIDSLEVHFGEGLQVITGETGAGKSIILGALRLILGERADSKAIQNSETKSIVEAEFIVNDDLKSYFDEADLDFQRETIIRREILPSGKSRAFVNDVPVTLDALKALAEKLIDIHSQFETSNLFSQEYQFKIIDGLSENKIKLNIYQSEFSEFRTLRSKLETLKEQLEKSNKETDYRTFLLNELSEHHLEEIDLEDLQSKLSLQENAETISENLHHVMSRFDAEEVGILDALNDVRSRLSKTSELSHHFSEIFSRFESHFLELKDFLFELQNEAENIETDTALLDELNAKINTVNALFLKHNVNSVAELIEIREGLAAQQNSMEELEISISETEKLIGIKEQKLEKMAAELSKNRKKAAPVFTKKAEEILKHLGLEKARIEVDLSEQKNFGHFGKDDISLLFQANSGFPLKPIQTAVSGGERSRVMLAVKKIIAENTELPTLILDEIDTGVSGKVAEEMGMLMREMSQDMQLIVISHLAQVAAKGDRNYKVVKQEIAGRTQSNILSLNGEEKLQEIAQLLSGSKITEAALRQAEELMK